MLSNARNIKEGFRASNSKCSSKSGTATSSNTYIASVDTDKMKSTKVETLGELCMRSKLMG